MTSICYDNGPHPIREPHGPWWLTIRLPLGRLGHVYIGATTGRNRFRGRFPFLRVAVHRRPLRRPYRPDLLWSLHRWCAHIDVSYEAIPPAECEHCCPSGWSPNLDQVPNEDCPTHGRDAS